MKTKQILLSYINAYAFLLSKLRPLENEAYLRWMINNYSSSKQDMIDDWNNACTFLALQIIDGNIPFNDIDPDSFEILESVWEKNIKLLKAYFIWKDSNRSGSMDENYFEASQNIRKLLFEGKLYPLTDFNVVRKYIENRYLDTDGKIDETKKATQELIRHKAERIFNNTGNRNDNVNWFRAKLYVRFFYENIIPAVVDKDEEKINFILKAFEFSKSPKNRFLIINAFEAVIAIYFINKDKLKLIINNPESYGFNMVQIYDWPNNFTAPSKKFRFDLKVNLITYEGVMSEKERDELLRNMIQVNHHREIVDLYEQSHLMPYPDMIL